MGGKQGDEQVGYGRGSNNYSSHVIQFYGDYQNRLLNARHTEEGLYS